MKFRKFKFNLSFFKKKFSLKVINKPFFIGTLVALILSVAPVAYMALELNNQKVVSTIVDFLNSNSGLEWKSFKSFNWSLLPSPSLRWQQIELKEKNQNGSIHIKELSMNLSASQLLNGVISVKKLSIAGVNIEVKESINSITDFCRTIFNLETDISGNKKTIINYKYKDLKLIEFFIFNPYVISITDANFSQITELADIKRIFYDGNLTLTKRMDSKDILQLASVDLRSKLLVDGFDITLKGECISSIDKKNKSVYCHNADFDFMMSKKQQISVKLSGDLEYGYKNNFVQSNVKGTTKNIQELASLFDLNIPKKINHTEFNSLSINSTIIYKDNFIKSNNLIIEAPEFELQGNFNYNFTSKKILSSFEGSGLVFGEVYQEYKSSSKNKFTDEDYASDEGGKALDIINTMNIFKYLPNKNLYIVYSPKYFRWKNIVLNYPTIELKKLGNICSLHYESDVDSGKLILSSKFKQLHSSIESKIECIVVALDIGSSCSHIGVCQGSKGEMHLTSNISMNIDNNNNIEVYGVVEANTENILIPGIDLDYVYRKFINATINKEIEYKEVIAKTHFNKMKAKITIENKKINLFKIESYTENSKILGNGVLDTKTNKAKINLKIFPINLDPFYNNEYPGEFHDMVLPVVCQFSEGSWRCNLDKDNFKSYLQNKKLESKLIEKILNMDLSY